MAATLENVMEKLSELGNKLEQIAASVGITAGHPYQRILDKEQPVGTIEPPPAQVEGLKPSELLAKEKEEKGEKVDLNTMGAPVTPIAGVRPEVSEKEENWAEHQKPATSEELGAKTPTPPTTARTTTAPKPSSSS